MKMNAMLMLILMFAVGLALGAFYFISLWQTVKRLSRTESRARLLIVSYLLRLSVVLPAFYFLLKDGRWERLAIALVGFVVMRKILTHHFGPPKMLEAVPE
ncbi:MAG: ATP synthase subunit I [Syntrophaceae bacterium]|jgi:F1F0 ATPase subunit 2|nr:ATP synthase subunit I [Syntrophaceae bacterium]